MIFMNQNDINYINSERDTLITMLNSISGIKIPEFKVYADSDKETVNFECENMSTTIYRLKNLISGVKIYAESLASLMNLLEYEVNQNENEM